MKKITFTFLIFAIIPFSAVASFFVNCKLISQHNSPSTDYNNVWIINIDKSNNFFSIIDTYANATFSSKNGDLKFLGIYGGFYYMILKKSGYLYVYRPPTTKSSEFWGKGNKLDILDPRGNAVLYVAECSNIRN